MKNALLRYGLCCFLANLLSLAFATANATAYNWIYNGGFEASYTSDWVYHDPNNGYPLDLPGWTVQGGVALQRQAAAWGSPVAPEGQQTVVLQGYGSIGQQVYLPPGQYTLSFKSAHRTNYGLAQGHIVVLLDGAPIYSWNSEGDSFVPYQVSFSTNYYAYHTITLSSDTLGDRSAFIDDVTLTEAVYALNNTKNKIALGQSVNIVLSGDSLTQSYRWTYPESYVFHVAQTVRQQRPGATVIVRLLDPHTLAAGASVCGARGADTDYSYAANNTGVRTIEYAPTSAPTGQVINIVRDGISGQNVFKYLARIASNNPFPPSQNAFSAADALIPISQTWNGHIDAVVLGLGTNDALASFSGGPSACYPESWASTDYNMQSFNVFASQTISLFPWGVRKEIFPVALTAAVNKIKQYQPGVEIALMTPQWYGYKGLQYTDNLLKPYANIVRQVAGANAVGIVDTFNTFELHWYALGGSGYFVDGSGSGFVGQGGWFTPGVDDAPNLTIHPNSFGSKAMADTVTRSAFGWGL